MKKVLPVVLASVALLGGAGCASTKPVDDTIQNPSVQEDVSVKNNVNSQTSMPNSPQEKVQAIDKKIASEKVLTFALPNATSVITKREMSGVLDAENTGKISRNTEGVGYTRETYYFDKGELVYAEVETGADGQNSIKDMFFENKKAVSFLIDGENSMNNKNLSYLEEQNLSDAKDVLETFIMKKQVSGE